MQDLMQSSSVPSQTILSLTHSSLAQRQQLHRHVLYHTQPGDVVVVDARGSMTSGVFGEMMMSYFLIS